MKNKIEDYKLKFSKAMNRFGLIAPSKIISDGKMHVCRVKDHLSNSREGWYIFFAGKPSVGLYGCWGIKRYRIWRSKSCQKMTIEENDEYLDKLYIMRDERKMARKKHFPTNSCKQKIITVVTNKDSSQSPQNHKNESTESSTTTFDPAEFVKKCREQEMDDIRIAHDLMRYYGKSEKFSIPNQVKLSALAIGLALFPMRKPETRNEKDALEAMVWRRVRKYPVK